MKLIFAQANPGTQYNHTRHNVGAALIEHYAAEHGTSWKDSPKFFARIAELTHKGEKVLLVIPTTYYNETGRSARAICDFYKLDPAQDVLVIHDDLALPFGTLRTRAKGSDAGNNGIKSLNAHLGDTYHRVRVGIQTERHPGLGDADFVLGSFSQQEREHLVQHIMPHIQKMIDQFVENGLTLTSHHTTKEPQ